MKNRNRNPNRIADKAVEASGRPGRVHDSPDGFLEDMLGHASRHTERMEALDVSGQARYLRRVFKGHHVVLGIWPEPASPLGYSMIPVKGGMAEMQSMLDAGRTRMMLTAVSVEEREEAETLSAVWALQENTGGMTKEEKEVTSMLFRAQVPGMRATMRAHTQTMRSMGLID
ncbi:MAG: hypothetical protein INR70_00745 [Parafilimonas terrae]|nr:hypothetical protein [Parafilimonas terrae]